MKPCGGCWRGLRISSGTGSPGGGSWDTLKRYRGRGGCFGVLRNGAGAFWSQPLVWAAWGVLGCRGAGLGHKAWGTRGALGWGREGGMLQSSRAPLRPPPCSPVVAGCFEGKGRPSGVDGKLRLPQMLDLSRTEPVPTLAGEGLLPTHGPPGWALCLKGAASHHHAAIQLLHSRCWEKRLRSGNSGA